MKFGVLPYAVMLCLGISRISPTRAAELKVLSNINYTSFSGLPLVLNGFEGAKVGFLTPPGKCAALSLRSGAEALETAYKFFATITEREPHNMAAFQHDGRNIVAVVPVACTTPPCAHTGASGAEIDAKAFAEICASIAHGRHIDRRLFEPLALNFWFLDDILSYREVKNASFVRNAVAEVLSRKALHEIKFDRPEQTEKARLRSHKLQLNMDQYLRLDPGENWTTIVLKPKPEALPSGLIPEELLVAIMMKLQKVHGDKFFPAFLKAAAERPVADDTALAIENFVVASSSAAAANLGRAFKELWRWPLSDTTAKKLETFGAPADPAHYR